FLHLRIINGPDTGLTVKRGSSVFVRNVAVTGHPTTAMSILRTSFVQLENSFLAAPPSAADTIEIVDNSVMQVIGSTIIGNAIASGSGAAVGVYRGAVLRVRGNTKINHSGAPNADAFTAASIGAYDNSTVRVQDTGNEINGNVAISDMSAADIRDLTINGNLVANRMSLIEFRNTTSVVGDIQVGVRSLVEYRGASQTGGASCFADGAVRNVPAGLTPTNCVIY
ncbi:MAG: hypothetical protein KKB37_10160, partial [Alphaproteobacteria bacterium]|nr:hypothetical protein [Alphaproteobacteria bacterium]